MEANQKQPKIQESVEEFLKSALRLKDSVLIEKYFGFMKKVPDHAPFNNTLVFIQNPDCGYYATPKQWEKRFNRKIRRGARPMVVMFPFGPVDFVYDLDDTTGEEITQDQIINWWREHGGRLDETIVRNTQSNLDLLAISYKSPKPHEYFDEVDFRTGGFAKHTNPDDKFSITLHPRYSEPTVESYGVLCHEIAHILLGHLGRLSINRGATRRTNEVEYEIVKDRRWVKKPIKEVEAELVAWLVFNGLGIEKNSASYVAGWLGGVEDVAEVGMVEVLKVAAKIQEMGKKSNAFRISTKSAQ